MFESDSVVRSLYPDAFLRVLGIVNGIASLWRSWMPLAHPIAFGHSPKRPQRLFTHHQATSGLLLGAALFAMEFSNAAAMNWTLHQVPAEENQIEDPDGSAWVFTAIATSTDGTKLVAVTGGNLSGGPICVSTNSAQTWQVTSAPLHYWTSVASSADGVNLVASGGTANDDTGGIYISSDSGRTWRRSAPFGASLASSADGVHLVALKFPESSVPYPLSIYLSHDSGATWQPSPSPAATNYWKAVSSSADGKRMVAIGTAQIVQLGFSIYTSADSGASWQITNLPEGDYMGIASSTDGIKLVAVSAFPSRVYTSTDAGASWTLQKGAPQEEWNTVASSADGKRLVAGGSGINGQLYTSTDGGVTWLSNNNAPTIGGHPVGWLGTASSADGKFLVALPRSIEGIYTLSSPVVELAALEVIQVIQDWNQTIPLIAGKETYVRAHLQLPVTNHGPVKVSGAKLYASGPGGPLTGSPLTPINRGGALTVMNITNAASPKIRGQMTNSLNFRLPTEWSSGSVRLELVWTNDGGLLLPMNIVPADSAITVKFVNAQTPRVKFFSINWTNASGDVQAVNTATLNDLSRRLRSCYPVAEVDATFGALDWPTQGLPSTSDVNAKLAALRLLDASSDTNTTQLLGNRIYYGAMLQNKILGEAEAIPGFVASGCLPPNPFTIGRHTHSHEIGHCLGRHHDISQALFGTVTDSSGTYAKGKCGEAGDLNYVYPLFQTLNGAQVPALGPLANGDTSLIYGLDSLAIKQAPGINPVLDPTAYFDFMGYCSIAPLDFWPSSFTYTNLLSTIHSNFGPVSIQLSALDGPERPILLVRGTVDFSTDSAEFLPFITVNTRVTLPSPSPGTSFSLLAFDDTHKVLQTLNFSLKKNITEFDDPSQKANFILPITHNPALHSVELRHGNRILAIGTASSHPPKVTLTNPKGGETFKEGPIHVSWTGTDDDLDALTFTVQYSPDNGSTWQTLNADLDGDTLEIESKTLTATSKGLIRVLVSDGFNTSFAQTSAPFTVKPHAPELSISTPIEGAVFEGDEQIFLEADVFNDEGSLDGNKVRWVSSIDGFLGEGKSLHFPATRLTQGYHTLSVSSTNSAGLGADTRIHVVVLTVAQPELQIFLVDDQIYLAWPNSYQDLYSLEGSSNLDQGWKSITTEPTVADSLQFVPVDLSSGMQFFRLRLRQQ